MLQYFTLQKYCSQNLKSRNIRWTRWIFNLLAFSILNMLIYHMQNNCLENFTGKPAAMRSLETSRKMDKNIEGDLWETDWMEGVWQWFRIVASRTIWCLRSWTFEFNYRVKSPFQKLCRVTPIFFLSLTSHIH